MLCENANVEGFVKRGTACLDLLESGNLKALQNR
jgi:hypothetical protein